MARFIMRYGLCKVDRYVEHRNSAADPRTHRVPIFNALVIVPGKNYRGRIGAKDRARMARAGVETRRENIRKGSLFQRLRKKVGL